MGWLQEQLDSAAREVESWPEWKRDSMRAEIARVAEQWRHDYGEPHQAALRGVDGRKI